MAELAPVALADDNGSMSGIAAKSSRIGRCWYLMAVRLYNPAKRIVGKCRHGMPTGNLSPWSLPASFGTGLSMQDWNGAKWIA
ncbi:MAG: hypothetical protein ACLR8Y_05580 [Alistipes indistinctus]